MATFRRFKGEMRYSGHLSSRLRFAATQHHPKKAVGTDVEKEHTEHKRSVSTLKYIALLMELNTNNLPTIPSRGRNGERNLIREQQAAVSPNYDRRRLPLSHQNSPSYFALPVVASQHQIIDPLDLPPPVIVPEMPAFPHELRMSQLRARAAQLLPIPLPARRGGRASRNVSVHVSTSTRTNEQLEHNMEVDQSLEQQTIPVPQNNRRTPAKKSLNYARQPGLNSNTVELHSLGSMNVECPNSKALH